ncbi:MAG: hypothetical protein CMP76_04695 [Flavobacterium sp.]|uniref:hypothetical protein n=1 Tax=Flavobacterium sp. TaxID=239 RepID=UPI000C455B3A|nr:hypothetical protein [Flavobacterium sp.]MBF02577.1 hypothetical protein [Flavobacterium sp.]|tara:strand:+ start:846 stop:1733 length:888 start_codon:yes stop_codon:yes gene_type:complete
MKKQIQKICNSLSIALIVLSSQSKLIAQETFTLNNQVIIETYDKYKVRNSLEVYQVIKPDSVKQFNYIVKDTAVNSSVLNGEFEKIGEFRCVLNPFGEFKMFDLFNDKKIGFNTRNMTKFYPVIKNIDTHELYFIMTESFIDKVILNHKQTLMLNAIHKLGYTEYKVYDELWFKSKTCEIKLDDWTYKALIENPDYIIELDNDQSKIENLSKQTLTHTQTLNKYLSIYNIKRSKMLTSDINAWKGATKKAQTLQSQIYKLTEKYDGNYSFKPIKKNNLLDDFLDSLIASKGVLGI